MRRSIRDCLRLFLSLLVVCAACGQSSRPGLPEGSPFAETEESSMKLLSYGTAVGDVSDHTAVIWVRTNGAANVMVEHRPVTSTRESKGPQKGEESQVHGSSWETTVDHDYTLHIPLKDLLPATRYEIRIQAQSEQTDSAQDSPAPNPIAEELHGEFRTLAAPAVHETVTFGWSADIGGQTRCRHGGPGYPIFDVARMEALDFFLLLGDTVYADEICPVPQNAPGSEFKAVTLEEYRAKHRYQRGSMAFQRFLASVPVYVVWDDHEVGNNFAGPFDQRMPIGRQALFEYWPIGTAADDPHRLYRRLRAGADLEVFVLDTRQYRSRNRTPDGPMKTMLGEAQLKWLLEGLEHSSAT
ncbi:MAG: alkaline phosphatase D family protein, partial [Nitrospiraceae bacterium]